MKYKNDRGVVVIKTYLSSFCSLLNLGNTRVKVWRLGCRICIKSVKKAFYLFHFVASSFVCSYPIQIQSISPPKATCIVTLSMNSIV